MLRTLLLFVALLLVLVIALVGFGVINLTQSENGGVAVETRDVELGTEPANVELPVVRMENRTVEVPAISVEDSNQQANVQ